MMVATMMGTSAKVLIFAGNKGESSKAIAVCEIGRAHV